MRLVIGSDHNGFHLKKTILDYMSEQGFGCDDLGTYSIQAVDYPDIALQLSEQILQGKYDRGILICGTGIGMAIVANKVPGIRAAQVQDPYSAERASKSNDVQIITLGAQIVGEELAKMLVHTWLHSEYSGGRSAPKLAKIAQIDERFRLAKLE
jgi:ribose 5-phosphate isomerase B